MQGQLNNPHKENQKISKENFARSFKIVVMHHYLFEPIGYKEDFFLRINDRDTVFRNFALADFDMCLCGHKHVPEFRPLHYGDHFDKRARGRYLIQLFRRMIGIHMMPFRFRAKDGDEQPTWFSQLFEILFVKVRTSSPTKLDSDQYIEELLKMLEIGLEKPTQFVQEVEQFVKNYESAGCELIDHDSLSEIHSRVTSELSKQERRLLGEVAKVYLGKAVKSMNQRGFIQSMSGSTTKRSTAKEKFRSFNLYSITMENSSVTVSRRKYTLDPNASGALPTVSEQDYVFENHGMLNCKIVMLDPDTTHA
jgi:predicted transcriptional regulator